MRIGNYDFEPEFFSKELNDADIASQRQLLETMQDVQVRAALERSIQKLEDTKEIPWPPTDEQRKRLEQFSDLLDKVAAARNYPFPKHIELVNFPAFNMQVFENRPTRIDYHSLIESRVPDDVIEGTLHHEVQHLQQQDPKLLTHLQYLNEIGVVQDLLAYAVKNDPETLRKFAEEQGVGAHVIEDLTSFESYLQHSMKQFEACGLTSDNIGANYDALRDNNAQILELVDAQSQQAQEMRARAFQLFPLIFSLPSSITRMNEVAAMYGEPEAKIEAVQQLHEMLKILIPPTGEISPVTADYKQFCEAYKPLELSIPMMELKKTTHHALEYYADDALVLNHVPGKAILSVVQHIAESEAATMNDGQMTNFMARSTHPAPEDRYTRQKAILKMIEMQKRMGCEPDVRAAIDAVNKQSLSQTVTQGSGKGKAL